MLSWKVDLKPRWTVPSEVKRRIGIFKRYSKNAVLATRPTFKKHKFNTTNKASGTNIRSRRISALEPIVEVQDSQDVITCTLTLRTSDALLNYIMELLENGGDIIPRNKLVLTVPHGLRQDMAGRARSFTDARWIKLPKSKKLVLATGRYKKDFKILYWGKKRVHIPPKKWFTDTVFKTEVALIKRFPRAMVFGWSRTLAGL